MSKFTCEIVRDFDGTYYANVCVDGKMVEGLPEHVNYNTLKDAIRRKANVEILKCKDMIWEKVGRKHYALIDATQTRNDCRVTRAEVYDGWEPCFN